MRDSYKRRGHLTVSKVELHRLTLPRTRLTTPRTSIKFENTRRARSDSFLLSRRAQPPLGTGKGTRTRVVALHKCAARPATAAIDSVIPVPPTKIAKCFVMPRRANSFQCHSSSNSSRQGRVHKRNRVHNTTKSQKVVHETKKKRRIPACARHKGRRRRI
jgi:hypothetical protein